MLNVAIAQLSCCVDPVNIAQRLWVRHQIPFSCHWVQSVQWVCFTEENVHDFRFSVVSHEIITGLEFVPNIMISSFSHEKMFQLPHNKPATYYN